MNNILYNMGIPANQPLYLYQQPMFMLTVSVVLIEDNGVIMLKDGIVQSFFDESVRSAICKYRFPGGLVKAGQETIQFSAVRQVKEQTGIALKKDALIPVDFRSSPERSSEGNVVDIGMVSILNQSELTIPDTCKWFEVDFEHGKLCEKADTDIKVYMDHDILLKRALDVALMIKE